MKYPTALLILSTIAGSAIAQDVQFDLYPGMYPLDMSSDGSVIVGNDQNFDAVRWTKATGIVPLGRGTSSLGIGAGSPDISDDGTRISATITTANGLFATQGIWTEGVGWEDLMPPPPADGGLLDNAYGSAWGLSGNGEHVVGLYWRPGHGGPNGDGSAHASFSDAAGVIVDLGSSMRDSRANHANFDGSVVVGWDTSASFGYWSPTVWENGTLTHLNTNEGWAQADYVTPDGNIIGGYTFNETFMRGEATVWHRGVSGWEETILGALPGTTNTALVRSMTPDGSIIVGYNEYNNFNVSGFIWTEDSGMEEIEDWLTDRGVVIPSNLNILDVTSISADGNVIAGIGASTFDGSPIGYIINMTPPCLADMNDDGSLNFFDVSIFLSTFSEGDLAADFNGDGSLNFFDVSEYLNLFSIGCP
ncbi:MAG: GC-type dockerin domain-anchored protein [Phycisphaerales bacterium]|nr:GC-type dockerin domain-anchored protein [Phycisphaerales bacterium]